MSAKIGNLRISFLATSINYGHIGKPVNLLTILGSIRDLVASLECYFATGQYSTDVSIHTSSVIVSIIPDGTFPCSFQRHTREMLMVCQPVSAFVLKCASLGVPFNAY